MRAERGRNRGGERGRLGEASRGRAGGGEGGGALYQRLRGH